GERHRSSSSCMGADSSEDRWLTVRADNEMTRWRRFATNASCAAGILVGGLLSRFRSVQVPSDHLCRPILIGLIIALLIGAVALVTRQGILLAAVAAGALTVRSGLLVAGLAVVVVLIAVSDRRGLTLRFQGSLLVASIVFAASGVLLALP